MPQECLAIYDTVLHSWLITWNPIDHTGQFSSNPKNAFCFPTEEDRSSALAYLNTDPNNPNRFIGQQPPPR